MPEAWDTYVGTLPKYAMDNANRVWAQEFRMSDHLDMSELLELFLALFHLHMLNSKE